MNHICKNFRKKIEGWKKEKIFNIKKGTCGKEWRNHFCSLFTKIILDRAQDAEYFKKHMK